MSIDYNWRTWNTETKWNRTVTSKWTWEWIKKSLILAIIALNCKWLNINTFSLMFNFKMRLSYISTIRIICLTSQSTVLSWVVKMQSFIRVIFIINIFSILNWAYVFLSSSRFCHNHASRYKHLLISFIQLSLYVLTGWLCKGVLPQCLNLWYLHYSSGHFSTKIISSL